MSDTQQLFKTEEFAKLCGVNKKTLIYYHSIGLFEPHFIDTNGYRYYSYHQYDTFSVILALKDLNMPLAEIKNFLDHRTPHLLVKTLQAQQALLQKRIQQLLHTSQVIDTAIKVTQDSQILNIEECIFEHQETAYLTLSQPFIDYDTKPFLNIIAEHIQYCNQNDIGDGYPLGGLVLKENVLSHNFTSINYTYARTRTNRPSEFSHIKPEGTYAVAYHKGDYSTTSTTYEKLITFIQSHNATIIGNSYEDTLLDYLSQTNTDHYLTKISIRVEKQTP